MEFFSVFAKEYDCSEPILSQSKKNKQKRNLGEDDLDLQIFKPGVDGFNVSQVVSFQRKCVRRPPLQQ